MAFKRQMSPSQPIAHPADMAAFEVAYALLRVAAYVPDSPLVKYLQSCAFDLVAATSLKDGDKVQSVIQRVESYLRLGEEMGAVHPDNVPMIVARARGIVGLMKTGESNTPAPQIVDLWPQAGTPVVNQKVMSNAPRRPASIVRPAVKTPAKKDIAPVEIKQEVQKDLDSVTLQRQTAILELIRQKTNCRMKDIQEELPDVSERTLRYDIHALIEKGEVERVGAGGPFSYYKPKEHTVGELPGVTESKGAFILPL